MSCSPQENRVNPVRWMLPVVLMLMFIAPYSAAGDEAAASDSDQPVILLTGFEPFGRQRLPNPSWEGIKELDGAEWNGYRLVARELQVVWGAPLEQLRPLVQEWQPKAVFSFGQGGQGSFAIESVARNSRAGIRDNNDERPQVSEIVPDGPGSFNASARCSALRDLLDESGFRTRVSTNGGRYLCEETLYTLEYLRENEVPGTSVMFCHVPPLGTSVDNTTVDANYVQSFVMATLGAWFKLQTTAAVAVQSVTTEKPVQSDPDEARRAEVEKLIRRYFKTWSDQDIDAYGECFLPGAVVQYIDGRGRVLSSSLKPFLSGQRDAHRRASAPLVEVPVNIEISFPANLATAKVFWKLTEGSTRTDYGYDHFTLSRSTGKWRIVNLVYYAVAAPE